MNEQGWAKIYRVMPQDAKVRTLSTSRRWIFVCYILLAQYQGRWRGYLVDEAGRSLTCVEKAAFCGIDKSQIIRAEPQLIDCGLLCKTDGDRVKITNYDRYQGESSSKEAVRNRNSAVAKTHQNGADCGAKTHQNGADCGAFSQQMSTECDPLRREEEKKSEEVTNPCGIGLELKGWAAVAAFFRKHWPSQYQGTIGKTIKQLQDEYSQGYTPTEVMDALEVHQRKATKDLKPWTIFVGVTHPRGIGPRKEDADAAVEARIRAQREADADRPLSAKEIAHREAVAKARRILEERNGQQPTTGSAGAADAEYGG